jgi:hypothetical protein
VGIGGTPMPAYGDSLTPEETWALAYYTLSLAKAPLTEPAPSQPGTVVSKFIRGQIPLDPSGPTWAKLPLARVHLEPLWIRKQVIEEVRVRSVHNGTQIAFLLEWDDPIMDHGVLRSQDFRDAVAIQFAVMSVELHGAGHPEPSFTMGDQHGPVNIWHWKADWEADLQRYRDLQDRYAGMAVDLYLFNRVAPPGSSVSDQVKAPTSSHDPVFLAGWGAGNPLSTPDRRSSVEDLNAIGFGTLTSQAPDDQNVHGKGVWKAGKWRVVMVREMRSTSDRDAQFTPGQSLPVAFAIWDGAHGDRDGQKAVSVWQRLEIEKVE